MYNCKFCGKEFKKVHSLGSHSRSCKLGPYYKENIIKIFESKLQNGLVSVTRERILNCKKCGEEYKINVNDKNFEKNKYRKNCSRKCANSHIISNDQKIKISKSLLGSIKLGKIKSNTIKNYQLINYSYFKPLKRCIICNEIIIEKKRKTCSEKCRKESIINGARKGGLKSATINCKRSKNEIKFYNLCKEHFKNNEILNNTPMFNGWDADVIIPKLKMAILWNGPYHYKEIRKNQSLSQIQNRDKIKIEEIKKCGYTPVIIKDLSKRYNKTFV